MIFRTLILFGLAALFGACGRDDTTGPFYRYEVPPSAESDGSGNPLNPSQLRAPLPTPRQQMPAVVLGPNIYVLGGLDSLGRSLDVVEVYDPARDSWSTSIPLPLPMYDHGAAVVDGKIFVFGGHQGSRSFGRATFVFDRVSSIWTRRSDMPISFAAMAVGVISKKIYIAAGEGAGPSSVMEYYPAGDVWSLKRIIPNERSGVMYGVAFGRLYVIGGENDGSLVQNVDVYWPADDSWSSEEPLSLARSRAGFGLVGGTFYVFSGMTPNGGPVRSIYSYDPMGGVSHKVGVLVRRRHSCASASLNDKVYLIGGSDGPGIHPTSFNEEYTPRQ